MSISAVRFFAATIVALSLIVLAQDFAPKAHAGDFATFDPDPLELLEGGSANLKVSVAKTLTEAEATNGVVNLSGHGREHL